MGITAAVMVPPAGRVVRAVHQNFTHHKGVRSSVGDRCQANIHSKTAEKTIEPIDVGRVSVTSISTWHPVDVLGEKRVTRTISGGRQL